MSAQELDRLTVIERVVEKRLNQVEASKQLGVTPRHLRRLIRRYNRDGTHGLRHSYAQERITELQEAGKVYNEAREIVSQELGHFRADVVETYLR